MNGADIYMIALILVCAVGLIGRSFLMETDDKEETNKNKEQ